ncbi:MAG: imidazoleglycerol-phosphate dehydratase [Spirochaetales bacterium]|jgi:imidazoleglycerol-phosphate dehydratase|nr:imidazoleglycerol-phosphate dehydratase [Spirochaetales bacterium]
MPRTARIQRKTAETNIDLEINLDGSGRVQLSYPQTYIRRMLELFGASGGFDLTLTAAGDLEVDQHHLVEDTGLVLGRCFAEALGEKKGIYRCGYFFGGEGEAPDSASLPQVRAVVDFSGRPFLVMSAGGGDFPDVLLRDEEDGSAYLTGTVQDFWQGFTAGALCNMHLDIFPAPEGSPEVERKKEIPSLFDAAARALRAASLRDSRAPETIPSTKGVLI